MVLMDRPILHVIQSVEPQDTICDALEKVNDIMVILTLVSCQCSLFNWLFLGCGFDLERP